MIALVGAAIGENRVVNCDKVVRLDEMRGVAHHGWGVGIMHSSLAFFIGLDRGWKKFHWGRLRIENEIPRVF